MDKISTEKTPYEINGEFDERKLNLLKIRERQIQDAQRRYFQTLEDIWAAHGQEMEKLKKERRAALAQCAQGDKEKAHDR